MSWSVVPARFALGAWAPVATYECSRCGQHGRAASTGLGPKVVAVECARDEAEEHAMPKMKTDTGAKARFKRTGSGKLMRRHAFASHLLEKKSAKRLRRLRRESELAPGDARRARRQLAGR